MAQRGDYPRYYSECSYFVGNTCVSGVSVCWSAPCSWESEGPRTSDPTRPHALHTPGGWKGTGDGMRLWWHFFSISGFINFLRLNIHFFFFLICERKHVQHTSSSEPVPQVRKAFVRLQMRPVALRRGRELLCAGPSWTSPCVPSTPSALWCHLCSG